MINIKSGNILNCTENIICHQVNVQGIMGGGLARQLADRYPDLENAYSEYCRIHNNRYIDLSADILFYVTENKVIANMFSQKENFDTDYLNMEIALTYLKKFAQENDLSIAIPYGIGCGIANGEWEKIYKIIEELFNDYDVTLYRLEE